MAAESFEDYDDIMPLLEDDDVGPDSHQEEPWGIFIVDDDDEVHHASRFALSGIKILGRPLELHHAYSATEAEAVLQQYPEMAVMLLDVVMEANDAGLRLVDKVRNEMELNELRIILRTGQPGYAPELEIINRYDINDYRTKTELTQVRLITSLASALRSYQQIRTINEHRRGLRRVIDVTSKLLECKKLDNLEDEILERISDLLGQPCEGLVGVGRLIGEEMVGEVKITATTEQYRRWQHQLLSAVDDPDIVVLMGRAIKQRQCIYESAASVFFFNGSDTLTVAYVSAPCLSVANQDPEFPRLIYRTLELWLDNLMLIDRLHHFAYRDLLTGLPNRGHFLQKIERQIASLQQPTTLAVLDLDHFNTIIETIGPTASDQLLCEVATRLRAFFAGQPVELARVAADAFAIMGPTPLIDRQCFLAPFTTPFEINGLSLTVTATCGLAELDSGGNAITALSGAYTALKLAKNRQRGGYERYTSSMSRDIQQRIELLHELGNAIKSDQFFLVFQPQVRLEDSLVVGCEVLLRWRKANGMLVPPDRFIPIAENSGMVISIGEWVFCNACRSLRQLIDLGWQDVVLAVNVSIAQLRDSGFMRMIDAALREFDIPPKNIEIELTETMAMEEIELTLKVIDQLKETGLRVSLDDFGTGFSSLAYLQRLRIDRLKIDRSFVNEIGHSNQGERIAETVVQLGRHLNLEVLAEGVETRAQAQYLLKIGCHLAQGYLYAKPMELEMLLDWFNANYPKIVPV